VDAAAQTSELDDLLDAYEKAVCLYFYCNLCAANFFLLLTVPIFDCFLQQMIVVSDACQSWDERISKAEMKK
jgi:hypothetical protein